MSCIWIYLTVAVVILAGVSCVDLCKGTQCTCSEYPVRIVCETGARVDMVDKLVRRVAISLEIRSDNIMDLLYVDLNEFVSLRNMNIKVYLKDACLWAFDKRRIYTNVRFNLPDFCQLVYDVTGKPNIVTTAETSYSGDENTPTYIVITVNELILGFFLLSCLSLCGLLRPYLRYVSFIHSYT